MNINIERNPIFAPLWKDHNRYIIMRGSAGSGKSADTAQYYICKLLGNKGVNLLCVRKIYQSNSVSTFNELVKCINRLGLQDYFTIKQNPMQINVYNGNSVLFGGVNDAGQREKLKSITALNGNITDVWIEEATEITQNDFEIIDDRLRGVLPKGLYYQIRMTFNPVSSSHWIKKNFFDRADKNVTTHKSTYLDNKFCDKAYHERMQRRKEVDPEGYRIYGLGEWGETSGLIFSNYIVEDIIRTEFDQIRYGQDFGFNHANAILKIGFKDDEVYILKEIYVNELTTGDIIELAQDWNRSTLMYCDSAEPDRIKEWQRAGFKAIPVKKYPGSLNAGINWLKQRKIHINSDCVGTIQEISQWRWKKDSNDNYTDIPVPLNDDAMAALRYACSEFIAKGTAEVKEEKEKPHYNWDFEKPRKNTLKGGKIRVI